MMGKWFALPTWLISYLLPYPKGHPWHKRRFTLQKWYDYETDLCREFDFGFWMIGIATVLLILVIMRGF